MSLNKDMGDKHEEGLRQALGGRQTRGSGNQWQNPADVRHSRYEEPVAFAWDGKSTYGKSIAITRDMLAKIREQAAPEYPGIGLRFYDETEGTARLAIAEDWVAVPLDIMAALLDMVRAGREDRCPHEICFRCMGDE